MKCDCILKAEGEVEETEEGGSCLASFQHPSWCSPSATARDYGELPLLRKCQFRWACVLEEFQLKHSSTQGTFYRTFVLTCTLFVACMRELQYLISILTNPPSLLFNTSGLSTTIFFISQVLLSKTTFPAGI